MAESLSSCTRLLPEHRDLASPVNEKSLRLWAHASILRDVSVRCAVGVTGRLVEHTVWQSIGACIQPRLQGQPHLATCCDFTEQIEGGAFYGIQAMQAAHKGTFLGRLERVLTQGIAEGDDPPQRMRHAES